MTLKYMFSILQFAGLIVFTDAELIRVPSKNKISILYSLPVHVFILTLPMLRLLLPKAQECNDF